MPRILVVEDEFIIRLMLAEALADAGFDVIEAADGNEAAALLQSGPGFDVVLTDFQLPGRLHGMDIARLARARAPELPVIFVTGRPFPVDQRHPTRDRVIAKPCLPSDVCAAALQLLAAAQTSPA